MAGLSRRPARPSHATVVAYLALFVALGGSSYAALSVGSRQIVDNSVRSKDIRDDGVRGRDVRRDTLSGADIAESTLGPVPRASSADTALGVTDGSINGTKVQDDSLTGADIIESQLGTIPVAATALSAQDIANGIVTSGKVPQDALTGDDIDEASLTGVDAETLAGEPVFEFARRTVFGSIAHPFSVNIPFFGRLTTECAAANTEWHYLNNTGQVQHIFMDVGGSDAVFAQLPNNGTLDSGNNGALAPGAERIIWQSFNTLVVTTSVRTAPSTCRMTGLAYFPTG